MPGGQRASIIDLSMRGELSSGLPQLATSGNRIVRADTGLPVLLRGINRSGLEYTAPSDAGFLAAAQFTQDEVHEMVVNWGANILRIPFNQDWALRGRNGHKAEEYLAALDRVILWASAFGAYTILDLQWLDADTVLGTTGGKNNYVAPTPNADTIVLWNTLAARYRDESAVLFDLLNEPHNRLPDDPHPIHLLDGNGHVVESDTNSVGAAQWVPWATKLVNEVRKIRPNGLILVGGVNWAYDLRGIRVNAPNIVYSAHIYPRSGASPWANALGSADQVPVFIGEWGGEGRDTTFGHALADTMRHKGLCWTAWSWVDAPQLVQPPRAPQYLPTNFGKIVRAELRPAPQGTVT